MTFETMRDLAGFAPTYPHRGTRYAARIGAGRRPRWRTIPRPLRVYACRLGWHRFDRRSLRGEIRDFLLGPHRGVSYHYVHCFDCDRLVNTTVEIPSVERFPA